MQLLHIITDFIAAVGFSSSIEIYNSAGLRYELALHLKTQLPPELYGVHLARKLKEVATPLGIAEGKKRRIDLYVFHWDKKEQYAINLKLLKKEEKLTRILISQELKSLELLTAAGFRESYTILVAPSRLLAEAQETSSPASAVDNTVDNTSKLEISPGQENSASVIRFPDQFPWQILRLPCTGDSVQWYYALIRKIK